MSLKVVLADESSTIKKVFQLALQDFAVEVFSAHSGEDVIEICKRNSPDIVFIDTLLQKKSGYKVCHELKKHSEYSQTPVVLMWSSFVELDQDKFLACMANADIEKPFEVQALRELIKSLVPEVNQQEISNFLQMPDIEHKKVESQALGLIDPSSDMNPLDAFVSKSEPEVDNIELEPIDNIHRDDFEQVNLNAKIESIPNAFNKDQDLFKEDEDTEPGWVTKTLSNSKTDFSISPDLDETDSFMAMSDMEEKINTVVNQQVKISNTKFKSLGPEVIIDADETDDTEATSQAEQKSTPINVSEAEIERIVAKIAKPMIEQAVWRIVPEVAAQHIEREIQRLLNGKTQTSNETY